MDFLEALNNRLTDHGKQAHIVGLSTPDVIRNQELKEWNPQWDVQGLFDLATVLVVHAADPSKVVASATVHVLCLHGVDLMAEDVLVALEQVDDTAGQIGNQEEVRGSTVEPRCWDGRYQIASKLHDDGVLLGSLVEYRWVVQPEVGVVVVIVSAASPGGYAEITLDEDLVADRCRRLQVAG